MVGRLVGVVLVAVALAACDEGGASLESPSPGQEGRADGSPDAALDASSDAASLDAAEPDVSTDAAPDASPDAAVDGALPDAAPDAGPPVSRPRFDPAGAGFYDTPWPSDARLTAAGTPDLSTFPARGASLGRIIDEIESHVVGYATMPIVYVAFDDAIADLPLPSPVESIAPDSPIQLLELGERCGTRVPVEASVRARTLRYIAAETLQVKNTVGTVLTPRTPHALVVLRSFGAAQGRPAITPPAFTAAWNADGSRHSSSLQPLRDCMPRLGLDPADIAVATVFTPQDPVAELQAMRDFVMDPAHVETRAPVDARRDGVWSRRRLNLTTFTGLVEMPVFQDGDTPYLEAGGHLVPGPDGIPLIQRWEPVPFAVAFRDLDPPPATRPVLVFLDGTGWDPWDHLRGAWMNGALDAGFVVCSFMPQFHGGRAGVEGRPELPSFNFLNPPAGRTNFRQQAVEISFFSRVIREQFVGLPGLPPLDTTRLVYGGHSQGSLTGALNAAVESAYVAYVFNGLSAYLTLTILERKDILDFERIVRTLVGNDAPLDEFAPALQLMQIGGEAVDPHNFARLWRGTPSRPDGAHVFVTNGFTDDTTTPRGMDHLTIGAGIPTFDPPGWDIDPFDIGPPPPAPLPVQGNATALSGAPLTLATYLDPVEGHGTMHRLGALRQMAIRFWQQAVAGEVPALRTTRELMCDDGGDDDADGAADCADDDCAARQPCVEAVCDDMLDGDGDGPVDCADPDCRESGPCQEPACGDGADEDADGLIDCADPGCAAREPCVEVACRDGLDGDGDGALDCADPECVGRDECRELDCANGADEDGDGALDCADDECLRSPLCPEPSCVDGSDEDGNGLADCADPRCAGQEACPIPAEAVCDDANDDDGDGHADCADPDCAAFEPCRTGHCADGDLGTATGIAVYQGTLEGRPDTWEPGDCTPLGTGAGAPDLALRWTAPASGVYIASTLGSARDTVLTVFPDDCDRARELACSDDARGTTTSALGVRIDEGQSVVFVISAFEAVDAARVVLHVYPDPTP